MLSLTDFPRCEYFTVPRLNYNGYPENSTQCLHIFSLNNASLSILIQNLKLENKTTVKNLIYNI